MELMVAMVTIGLVVIALYAGISHAFMTVRLAREDLRATQILVEKMEAIRLYDWDQITAPNFIANNFFVPYDVTLPSGNPSGGLTYHGTLTISAVTNSVSYADDMRKVTVEVKWTSGNLKRQREISTYVCSTGLQNYKY
jgi:hypothetical protein